MNWIKTVAKLPGGVVLLFGIAAAVAVMMLGLLHVQQNWFVPAGVLFGLVIGVPFFGAISLLSFPLILLWGIATGAITAPAASYAWHTMKLYWRGYLGCCLILSAILAIPH